MKVAVIGGGTMGNGIAHVFAQTGHEVVLIDAEAIALNTYLLENDLNNWCWSTVARSTTRCSPAFSGTFRTWCSTFATTAGGPSIPPGYSPA